jgi:uncharacterized SAM-binding protein YcdF (DUF218 family)
MIYYLLSKVLPALLMPLSVLFWGSLLGWWVIQKKYRKTGYSIICAVFLNVYIFSLSSISQSAVKNSQKHWENVQPTKKAESAVVLGGFMISFDHNDEPELGGGVDRLFKGVELYRSGMVENVVISGGVSPQLDRPPEADLVHKFIRKFNLLPDSVLIIENRSINTEENARFTKEKLDSLGLTSNIILVTSATHMDRAIDLFTNEGFTIQPAPTDFTPIWKPSSQFPMALVPSPSALSHNSDLFREWLGKMYYKVKLD